MQEVNGAELFEKYAYIFWNTSYDLLIIREYKPVWAITTLHDDHNITVLIGLTLKISTVHRVCKTPRQEPYCVSPNLVLQILVTKYPQTSQYFWFTAEEVKAREP